jgi:hypothetical protein
MDDDDEGHTINDDLCMMGPKRTLWQTRKLCSAVAPPHQSILLLTMVMAMARVMRLVLVPSLTP